MDLKVPLVSKVLLVSKDKQDTLESQVLVEALDVQERPVLQDQLDLLASRVCPD